MSEIARTYEYLAQRLSRKEPHLSSYALNKRAKILAFLRFLQKIDENTNLFEMLRIWNEEVGTAEGVMQLDALSQLGLRAGGTKVKVKVE